MRRFNRVLAALLAFSIVMSTTALNVSASAAEQDPAAEETTVSSEPVTEQPTESAETQTETSPEPAAETPISEEPAEQTVQENTPTVTADNTETGTQAAGELDLTTLINQNTSITGDTESVTVTCDNRSPDALILLSNCRPEQLQNLTIRVNTSGTLNLTNSAKYSESSYTYQSIGTEACPFQGTFNAGQQSNYTIDKPMFGTITSAAKISEFSIEWAGNGSEPMFVKEFRFTDGNSYEIPVTIQASTENVTPTMGSLISKIKKADNYTGEAGTLTIANKVNYKDATAVAAKPETGHAGLICGSLEAGTIVLDGYTAPNSFSVTSADGSAGGLIGSMADGTALDVQKAITLTSPTVTGETNAGGLVGVAKNVTLSGLDNVTLKSPTVKITTADTTGIGSVGGFIGEYTLSKQTETYPAINLTDPKLITNGTNDSNKKTDYEIGNLGGLFGKLILKNGASYTVDMNTDFSMTREGAPVTCGALIGQVISEDVQNALIINSITEKIITAKNASKVQPHYYGGMIGRIGSTDAKQAAYVEIKNVNVTAQDPFGKAEDRGFGGLVGCVGKSSVLKVNNVKTATVKDGSQKGDKSYIWEGGGIVGFADEGSAIEFSGITDVSGVYYVPRTLAGQLVGKQNSALIYAKGDGNGNGWTYIRAAADHIKDDTGTLTIGIDDIGNYGQVYRLKSDDHAKTGLASDFITIDTTNHGVEIKSNIASGDTITLSSAEDFAALAIAWQTRGKFVNAISDYTKKNITLGADIDLTGTGVLGLTRDCGKDTTNGTGKQDPDKEDIYTGTFDGGTHKLTLDIGQSYGKRSDANTAASGLSSGQIYRHEYIGLFAAVKGGAVQNLTLAGNITVDGMTNDRRSGDRTYYIGGCAARVMESTTVTNITSEISVQISAVKPGDGDTFFGKNTFSYVGGLYGYAEDTVTLNTITSKAKIGVKKSSANNSNLDRIYAGGVIGALAHDKTFTIDCNGVTLSGTITSEASDKDQADARIGGLIGYTEYNTDTGSGKRTININSVTVDGQKVEAEKAATCGGLLGYLWADTDVNFKQGTKNNYALTVTKATVNAPNAKAGGLVYRGTGKWTVNDYGISMTDSSFTAPTLGLLLCHAEQQETKVSTENYSYTEDGKKFKHLNRTKALYLEMTENWDTAYALNNTVTVTGGTVFDELIAYTAPNGAVTNNFYNGIISLATKGRKGVAQDGNTCNTYVNRTKNTTPNPNSRYYYNLDKIITDTTDKTARIDTPQKLLLWSVYYYASNSIQSYFYNAECSEITGELDMQGLSYYPISVYGANVHDATITFHNAEIEKLESSNKSTSGKTQHYLMHCGLFYNMQTGTDSANAAITNVTFKGSIGETGSGSGALCCNLISGNSQDKYTYILNLKTIHLNGLYVYNAGENYAPVLINTIGSCVTLNADGVDNTYTYTDKTTIAGSSLIGNVGGNDKTQIFLTFSNIHLPDTKTTDDTNKGIFTHATLLESFQYMENGVGSAVYNFYKEDDKKTDKEDHYNVTYGKEISASVEYVDLQRRYYDEDTYYHDDGYIIIDEKTAVDKQDFSSYLPYVCKTKATTIDTADKTYHEIMVNVRIKDITEGCGTYGDPYVITDQAGMNAVANYIANATARTGWRIRVTNNQAENHVKDTENADTVYMYNGNFWQEATSTTADGKTTWDYVNQNPKTLSNTVMHRYILSAYYDIQGEKNELELNNFSGLGTEVYPFRGVLTTTNKNGVTIKLTGTVPLGLIPYSYGSVVKGITIQYAGDNKTISYNKSDSDYPETAAIDTNLGQLTHYNVLPKRFFGGVIGCIVGGDNIIDGVTVNAKHTTDENNQKTYWKLTLEGDTKHLIEVGGYVGSVAGGGVIFRNITDNNGLHTANLTYNSGSVAENATNSLYVNPYIGRVLDGYAFSEGCKLNNTDKNYNINQLTAGIGITTDTKTNTVTIDDAQGLLVLSAIVNSGGTSGGNTYAYWNKQETFTDTSYNASINGSQAQDGNYSFGNGTYGKVRRASYSGIGSAENADDFAKANADDTAVPSTTVAPYLATTYSTGDTFNISNNTSTMLFSLTKGNYDMTDYGNGYQGISARYLSSAVNAGSSTIGSVYAKPIITGFKGNESTVKISMNVNEYADDDFHCDSVGGIFNLLRPAKSTEMTAGIAAEKALVNQLTISDSEVSLTYLDKDGNKTKEQQATNLQDTEKKSRKTETGRFCIGVGGFAGGTSANGVDPKKDEAAQKASYIFRNVDIKSSEFTGPYSAGGLIGSTGMTNEHVSQSIGLMFRNTLDSDGVKNWASAAVDNKNAFGVNLIDCTYSDITVTAGYIAGGFVGNVAHGCYGKDAANKIDSIDSADFDSRANSLAISSYSAIQTTGAVGFNSKIVSNPNSIASQDKETRSNVSGGLFGMVSTKAYINLADLNLGGIYQNKSKTLKAIQLKDLTITANATSTDAASEAGGAIGRVENNNCKIYQVEISGKNTTIYAKRRAGGILGCYFNNYASSMDGIVENCKSTDITIKSEKESVGGIVGQFYCNYSSAKLTVTNCISDAIIAIPVNADCSTGGIVGYLCGIQPLTMTNCIVTSSKIGNASKGYNGGLVGSMAYYKDEQLAMYNCVVKDTNIQGGKAAGALSSSAYGNFYGSNLLISKVQVTATDAGLLVGIPSTENDTSDYRLKAVSLAGVSIQGNCSPTALVSENKKDKFQFGTKSYIALADYNGTAANTENTLLDATSVSPYVVTSPKSSIKVTRDGKEQYLFGDGASKTIAQQIWNGRTNKDKFAYSSIGVDSFDFGIAFGTYNDNNAENPLSEDQNFDVLQVNSGENPTSRIENYLNIVTNGGYSQAKQMGKVSAGTALYTYNANTKTFVYSNTTPSLTVSDSGKNTMSFATNATDFDTTKQRFTLLTVTFTPESGHTYKVHVPIIVRRVLEVDFTATLNYGTHFKKADYDRTGHILDSFGNSMTAYLTYTYGSAKSVPTDFGWQTYINGGGDIAHHMEKQITLYQTAALPVGTQLTLIDCQDENRTAYYYTVKDGTKKTFSFSDFKASDNQTTFNSTSIGERIGINVQEAADGLFIKTNAEDATVFDGTDYYRLKNQNDTDEVQKYTVNYTGAATFKENYYLVITMPKTENQSAANGSIRASFETNIPYHVNYVLRDGISDDTRTNTASTYLLSNGYQQVLTETLSSGASVKEITATDSNVQVSVCDQITFPNGQAYNTSDELYQRFTGILQNQEKTTVSASSFPSGTSGTVSFYVYRIDENNQKKYYQYDTANKKWKTDDAGAIAENGTETPAVSYDWVSDGGNMELPLSTSQNTSDAISLQAIRTKLKNLNINNAESIFYVEAKLNASIPATGLSVIPESTIPAGNDIPDKYAKLSYVSQLSTEKNTLSYSSTKATFPYQGSNDTKMKYYRQTMKESQLTYDADDINQLGINLLDLEPNLDAEKQHAVIATTAIYDLSSLQNLEQTLVDSKCIRFTMNLNKKSTNSKTPEAYEKNNLTECMSIQVGSKAVSQNGDGTWTWTIPSTDYVTDGTLKEIPNVFDKTKFTQAILLQVDVDNVQAYSNYRVELLAQIIQQNGNEETVVAYDSDNVIYTLTKINPEFVKQ